MPHNKQLLENIGCLVVVLLISCCCSQPTNIVTTTETTATDLSSITPTLNSNPSGLVPEETATFIPASKLNLQLTFISFQNDKYYIYALPITNIESTSPCLGEPILLFEYDSRIYHLNWSPNGQRLVFDAAGLEGQMDVFIAEWDGSNITNLTNSPESEDSPVWSPDGSRIGYMGCDSRHCDFISANPDGSDPVRLLELIEASSVAATWSPNGEQILFSGTILESYLQIYLSNPDGSNLYKLTHDETDHYSPAFSSDGKWIAFVRIHDPVEVDYSDIFLIHPDGSGETNLTNGITTFQRTLTWAPLGNWLAFTGRTGEYSSIYIIHPDGTELINVTQGIDSGAGIPAWRMYSRP